MSTDPVILDFRGYKCPLPVLKARKAMHGAAQGARFNIQVNDPKAPADFSDFCSVAGYALESVTETDFGHEIHIKI